MPDSGTYLFIKTESRYLVVHKSGGFTTLEAVLDVETDEAAIEEFGNGWSGCGDPDLDEESSIE